MRFRHILSAAMVVLFLSTPTWAYEITREGERLARALDRMDVEHHWLPYQPVYWKDGKHNPRGHQRATHCSAFAAGACYRLGVYILRPPDHSQTLLANAQQRWLLNRGRHYGWHPVRSWETAQRLANEGYVVVASYRNPNPNRPGHVALVRPSTKNAEEIAREGPEVIWAGRHNHNRGTLFEGFKSHPKEQIHFFAHRPVQNLGATAARAEARVERPIRVAIYELPGGINKMRTGRLKRCLPESAGFGCRCVTAEDIRAGCLRDFNVLIVPGGSARQEAAQLGVRGRQNIRAFVRHGGGYVGVCAGSYLATPGYSWSLDLINARVVDRRHWARGNGEVWLRFTPEGRQALHEHSEEVRVHYAQGPLLAPGHRTDLPRYESLATFATGIAKHGAPRGAMVGTTAIARADYGEGRVVCYSPHPEMPGGPHHLIEAGVRWAVGQASP